MRQANVRKQFEAAIDNVEAALRDLSTRLEEFGSSPRRRGQVRRAHKSLRRTAGSVADRMNVDRAAQMATEAGHTVREHPVRTALTAAIAGYAVWSLIRYANRNSVMRREVRDSASRPHQDEYFGKPQSAETPDSAARH